MTFTPYNSTPGSLASALLASNAGIELVGAVTLHASSNDAVSFYDGSIQQLGIGAGLLLTSGYAPDLVNDIGWDGQDNSPVTGFDNGDADINTVVNTVFQTQSYDATALEFDFKATDPNATSISFDLVFGSEEFPEWVDAFVDCAVVIVNGVNYALFNHDPMAPLSVISPNLAAGYFQDNANNALNIQYDGVSHVLKIVAPINGNGALNHIKIGIADTGDHILDSGIFMANLSAGKIPGSGVVSSSAGGTAANDTVTGSLKSEYFDLQGGDDIAYAGGGDDIVIAGTGNDSVYGGSGADEIEGDAGDDHIDGGADNDTAVYLGNKADFTVSFDGTKTLLTSAAEGTDTLVGVEFVQFKDGLFALNNGALTAVSTTTPVTTNTPGSVAISGVAMAGKTLTAIVVDPDGLTGSATPIDYHWLTSSDGTTWTDTGITSSTFTLSAADTGNQIKVTASYVDAKGAAEAPDSAAVTIVQTSSKLVINPMVIAAPTGASVMDPLTTLIKNAVDFGYTPNEASLAVKSVLGVAADINLATYDAYAALLADPADATALAFMKIAVQVAMTASVSDPTGVNLTLAVLSAADAGLTLDLTNAADLGSAGVPDSSLSVVQGLNKDMADAGSFNTIQLVWNDWAGQKDNLKPFLGHIEAISVHINQAPVGVGTAELQTQEGTNLAIAAADLLAGFTDPDGGTLNATGLILDQGGSLTDNHDGTWTFTPDAGFSGPVELTYFVEDGQGAAVSATAMLIVAASVVPPPSNTAPALTGTQTLLAAGTEDTAYTLSAADLLSGFTDVDGDVLSVSGLTASNGVVADNGNGTYTISPSANFNGAVTLSYAVADGNGGTVSATQSYALAAVNDAPTGGVTITGTAKQGQLLTAANTLADADGLGAISYQWLANGSAINGATANTYLLTEAEAGKTISVKASYTDGFGTLESITSAATAAVLAVANLTLTGTNKGDTLNGDAGNDILSGLGGNDTLYGFAGKDVLDGGAGTDKLFGGEGSDRYIVGLASDHGAAEFTDTGAAGYDEVRFTTTKASTLTLYAGDTGIEQVTIGTGTAAAAVTTGTTALNVNAAAVGNALTIIGNAGANTLTGTAFGDTLDGGAGIDKLVGGSGNDKYIVDITAAGALQDTITETGVDTGDSLVLRGLSTNTTAVTLTLASTLEILDSNATSSSKLNLTGNAAANTLIGNAANNIINGLGGNDTLIGGAGADTLDGGTGSDVFVFKAVTDSNQANTDSLVGVDFGGLDLATAMDRLHFDNIAITGVSNIDMGGKQFADLTTTLDSTLMPVGQAVLVHVLNGVAQNRDFLLVDANGVAGFQSAEDYAIELVGLVNRAGFDLSDMTA